MDTIVKIVDVILEDNGEKTFVLSNGELVNENMFALWSHHHPGYFTANGKKYYLFNEQWRLLAINY